MLHRQSWRSWVDLIQAFDHDDSLFWLFGSTLMEVVFEHIDDIYADYRRVVRQQKRRNPDTTEVIRSSYNEVGIGTFFLQFSDSGFHEKEGKVILNFD